MRIPRSSLRTAILILGGLSAAPWPVAAQRTSPTDTADMRARQPAPPKLGPVGWVFALTGFFVAYHYGEQHQNPNPKKRRAEPVLWGLGGMAVGGLAGTAIDIPIRRLRNSVQLHSGSCIDTAGFVRFSGRDTLSVESVAFTMNGLTDVQAYRDHSSQYTAVLTRDLAVFDAHLRQWTLGARMSGEPTQRIDYRLRGDTAFYHDFSGPPPRLERKIVGPRGALLVDGIVGTDELVTRRALRDREFTPAFPTLYLASGGDAPVAHVFRSTRADSLQIRFGDDDVVADMRIDRAGRILDASYRASDGSVVTVKRVPCGDVDEIIRRWAR